MERKIQPKYSGFLTIGIKNNIKTGFFSWTITKHKKFLCDEDLMILKNWTTCKEKTPKSHVILLTTNKIYNKIYELKKAVNFSG